MKCKLTPEALVRAQAYAKVVELCEETAKRIESDETFEGRFAVAAVLRGLAQIVEGWSRAGQ